MYGLNKKQIMLILGGIGVFIAFIVICSSLSVVPTGSVGIKVRFGAVQDSVISEGLNIKAPFIEKIVKIDCKTKKIEVSSESSTRDLQTVNTSIVVNYNVLKKTANKLYQTVGIDYEKILIEPAMLESIKSAMAQYTAEELITKRGEVSDKILEVLNAKLNGEFFEITEFNLTNINFSDSYDEAIEAKAVAQQATEKAKAELQKAQIENQKKIENAKADAEVMRAQNQEITDKTLALKELEIKEKLIEKWNGQYPTTMLGNQDVLFNLGK